MFLLRIVTSFCINRIYWSFPIEWHWASYHMSYSSWENEHLIWTKQVIFCEICVNVRFEQMHELHKYSNYTEFEVLLFTTLICALKIVLAKIECYTCTHKWHLYHGFSQELELWERLLGYHLIGNNQEILLEHSLW